MDTRLHIHIASALIALLGIPLILRRVRPNPYYGLATRHTLADPVAWYDVNAFVGWALIASSAATTLAQYLLPYPYRLMAWLLLTLFLVPLAIAFMASFAHLRSLERHSASASPPGTDP